LRELLAGTEDRRQASLQHELDGMIAMQSGRFDAALRVLALADTNNPRVLFLRARAHEEQGEIEAARKLAAGAAYFNSLDVDHALIRPKAIELRERLRPDRSD
jgi:hypothetical protein